jgi:biopolymer transport protein ExbD
MSAGAPSGDDDSGQDFDLNLAPIIDCFTVLITYMLVSAAFISFQMVEVTAVATSDTPPPDTPPPTEIPMSLTVELKPGQVIDLHVAGKETAEYTIKALGDLDWDFPKLTSQLEQIKAKWPTIKEVSVKADNGTRYKQIVRVVEKLKKSISKVMVGE